VGRPGQSLCSVLNLQQSLAETMTDERHFHTVW